VSDEAGLRAGPRDRVRLGDPAPTQRQLVITTAGSTNTEPGGPRRCSSTCRRFQVGAGTDHGLAASRFLDTMLQATPADLARAF
jgi:hypothetical protein